MPCLSYTVHLTPYTCLICTLQGARFYILCTFHGAKLHFSIFFFIFVRDEIPHFCKESTPPDYFSGFAETGVYGWRIRFLGY